VLTSAEANRMPEKSPQISPKAETRPAKQTDLNREFEDPKRTTEWNRFFAALIAFTIISLFNLRSWG
jgi:hypothetical protein